MFWRGRKIASIDDKVVLDRLFAKFSENNKDSTFEVESMVYNWFLKQKLLEGAAFHLVAATKSKKSAPESFAIHMGLLSLYATLGVKVEYNKAQSLVKPDEDLSNKFHPNDIFVLSLRE